jgi:hypothetical protein
MWVIPEDLGNFSPKKKEKNLGEQKFTCPAVSGISVLSSSSVLTPYMTKS